MGINIATEQDIERLRMFSELQACELTTIRRKMAMMAARLAKAEGLDSQQVLEHLMLDIGADVNASSSSPLDSKSERWSGTDGHGQPTFAARPAIASDERLCSLYDGELVLGRKCSTYTSTVLTTDLTSPHKTFVCCMWRLECTEIKGHLGFAD